MLQIGGFAVVRHGGNEVTDWARVVALLPDETAARDLADRKIGALSLAEAFEQRNRLNDAAGFEAVCSHQWATIHALSPQLYANFAEVLTADEDGYGSFDLASAILEDFQRPRYAVGGHTVLCTEGEAEDLLYGRFPLYEGDPSEDATEALADAMGDPTHPMHEEHYEAEEEAFTRRYEREQLGNARAAGGPKTPAPG